ncbi:MAG: SO_0444 family Cu/Zn efflux transporter [Bdellovibrionales bacterium]|jgi:uncharacterized protein|nr:SO_0444 family Cu/Zn efflux transporter [Bdellovibrionales bacterium]MBT3525303.1 SO_0444 family Cu/Zn efflux transporter [Bdellovibrionales bacterium]MBT7668475.1 SO_0444 family Cu/Zn efflux transporter [Bdellovibrionales bacterium]MBT7766868.1 SO_0444 family Cu/Zn efflux transporter [Bdellovibrionales bacterium]
MDFINLSWEYINSFSPFLLLGLLLAGIIHAVVSDRTIIKLLGGKSILTVVYAAIVGVPLPLCSCSVVPMAVNLKKQGASNGATSSFLISTPESGVDSIAMTYAMMDLPMTIIRPVAAFLSAMLAGVAQHLFNDFEMAKSEPNVTSCCKGKKGSSNSNSTVAQSSSLFNRTSSFVSSSTKYAFVNLIDDMAYWMTLGIVAGLLINYFIPENMFYHLNGVWGKLGIILIGIPMYICASSTTPLAASLVLKGMSPGSAMILLLVGPATNLANMVVLQQFIGKKGVVINVLSISIVALIMAFGIDYAYETFELPINFKVGLHHEGGASLFTHLCSILLVILLGKGLYKSKIKPLFN